MITYIYYAHLASVRYENSVCRGSLLITTYICIYIYIYIYVYIYNFWRTWDNKPDKAYIFSFLGIRFQLWSEVETSTSSNSFIRNDNRSLRQTVHVIDAYFTDQKATTQLPKSRGFPCKSFKFTTYIQIQKLRSMFKTNFTH